MPEHNKTQRRTERETGGEGDNVGQAGQPTTREEMLREGAAEAAPDADVTDPHMVGTRGGGHAAQDVGSRHQEQEAGGVGHGRLHKSDEKPWDDREPPKRGTAHRPGNERA